MAAEPRRSSIEIVAKGAELRNALNEKKSTKSAAESRTDDAKRELEMIEHQVPLEELWTLMGCPADTWTETKSSGLTEATAAQFLARDGPNRLTPPSTEPEWKKFLKELFSFFACLLWLGSILCFIGNALRPDPENLYLGIVLAVVVTMTAVFGYFQNRKASDLMNSFKAMMPDEVKVYRDGALRELDASQLVKGDIVSLKAGDKVPADCRLLACSDDCQVDNASLTGESEPQKRTTEFTDQNPLETKNLCFFGTFVPMGSLTGVVVNTGDNTVMGRIATLATATDNGMTPIAKEIEHFIHMISAVAIFLGVTFLVIGIIKGYDIITNLVFMIGIIVANVPEGLLATVTVCLTLTANRMATKKVLVKNLEGVETLGSTTCICSDKTGTLTQNIMTVANLVFDCAEWDTACSLYPEASYDAKNETFQALARCATLCNNAQWVEDSRFERIPGTNKPDKARPCDFEETIVMGDKSLMTQVVWKPNGDASEAAMIKFVQRGTERDSIADQRDKAPKLTEIPFNSRNKYQLSVHNAGGKPLLCMKGAPERITVRCTKVMINGKVEDMTAERRAAIEKCQNNLSKQGRRVLGFCELELDSARFGPDFKYNTDNPNFPLGASNEDKDGIANDEGAPPADNVTCEGLVFLGMMALIDPPRPQVPPAVGLCKTAGIKVIMVTGDHPVTAKAIAYKVGILWGDTCDEVEEWNEQQGKTKGEAGWRNPKDQRWAPAIVVPGWTISVDTPIAQWDAILNHVQCVFARTSPQQKLIIVENCQRKGHIVAVTGDGVNDSPALKKADIGVAMGIMGSEVSKDAADMILLDDNFASIVSGIAEGRLIFDNLKKAIAYTLSSNIPEIGPFLVFIVVQTPLPLTTVLILCIDLGTDMVPAISMAWEGPESDIMERAPRNAAVDRLVTRKLLCFAYLQIGIIQAAAGFYTWIVVLNDYGYAPHLLPGLGKNNMWGKQPMYCKLTGGSYCNDLPFGEGQVCEKITGAATANYHYHTLGCGCVDYETKETKTWTNMAGVVQPTSQRATLLKKIDAQENCARDTNGQTTCGPTVGSDLTTTQKEANTMCPLVLWSQGQDGEVVDCQFAIQNSKSDGANGFGDKDHLDTGDNFFADAIKNGIWTSSKYEDTEQGYTGSGYGFTSNNVMSYTNIIAAGYVPYYPLRSRMSSFYSTQWWRYPTLTTGDDNAAYIAGFLPETSQVAFTYQPLRAIFVGAKTDEDAYPYTTNDGVHDVLIAKGGAQYGGADTKWSLTMNYTATKTHATAMGKEFRTITHASNTVNVNQAGVVAELNAGLSASTKAIGSKTDGFKYPYMSVTTTAEGKHTFFSNVFSRMSQDESLKFSQASYFVCIVVVQWADLIICKTRWLSIQSQGMRNKTMNFGIFFETILTAYLMYSAGLNSGLNTRPLRLTHWFPAMPFTIFIFGYDELRKYIMRCTSPVSIDKSTGRTVREPGWLERNTYY